MGVVSNVFAGLQPGSVQEVSNLVAVPAAFVPNGIHIRQVTARNAPSVINAVYNVRNFWDGRASNIFTGATPFGDSDTGLHALAFRNGVLQREAVRVQNASLARRRRWGRFSVLLRCPGPGARGRILAENFSRRSRWPAKRSLPRIASSGRWRTPMAMDYCRS